jgi:ABC-type transport system involved in multi-copper enzyme maturation permease subunit
MTKNFNIYIFIIIICIIIFTLYFLKFYKSKESFIPWDFNEKGIDKPNFVNDYELIKFGEPNYKYENITQYNFNRLFETTKKINNEKITFKDKSNYNFYTQSTTDDKYC